MLVTSFIIKASFAPLDIKPKKNTRMSCDNRGGCTNLTCCGLGGAKTSWPELLGAKSQDAEKIIQKENPNVFVLTWPQTKPRPGDFCCNRVVIIIDQSNNTLAAVPVIG